MIDQKLLGYLQASLAQNKSKEEIYKELLGQGWTIAAIEEAFSSISAQNEAETEKQETRSKTVQIVVIVGAVLVGAGIFSFIAANWSGMSSVAKVTVILASMIAVYALGWFLYQGGKYPKLGNALFLLGTVIYGAGIFLVAQIFNIRANWPDGFILWMFGAIAIGFAADSLAHLSLGVILGAVAIIGHPFDLLGIFEENFNGFLLTSSLLLAASTVVTFLTGWFIRRKLLPEVKESS